MARKTKSRTHKRRGRRQQGGGWGFTGSAFAPAGGMAPFEARTPMDDCATLGREAPSVTPTGAWSQSGGGEGCGTCSAVMAPPIVAQRGGDLWSFFGFGDSSGNPVAPTTPSAEEGAAIPPVAQSGGRKSRKQRGGGGGTGGYGFELNNSLGKVYAGLTVGPCPPAPQRGGGSLLTAGHGGGDASIVSYPAGYGYAPSSAEEVGGGTAHFLAQIPYGKQCMGGGARRHRKSHKKSRKRRHH